MSWIHGFEILCYILTALLLADCAFRKSWNDLFLFVSGSIAGFALELLAVRLTGIYHYNPDFYINIGTPPYQFPLFGGFMWGGLAVHALHVSRRLKLPRLWTAIIGGWLIVTMDLLLDVVAIRLDGGFWVWEGVQLNLAINHRTFMSVIWVNFLGYLFETPAILYMTLKTREKASAYPWWKRLIQAVLIGVAAVVFVGVASGLSLFLNSLTDQWFACLAFLAAWLTILYKILKTLATGPFKLTFSSICWPTTITWLSLYLYCLAALIHLGIAQARPVYFCFSIALTCFTLALSTTATDAAKRASAINNG